MLHTFMSRLIKSARQPACLQASAASLLLLRSFARQLAGFTGRYTAALLTSRTDTACQFIVVSYHGRYTTLSAGGAKKDDSLLTKVQEWRGDTRARKEARQFINLVAETACRLGKPAVIGGDWNAALMDRWLPQHEDWELHLRCLRTAWGLGTGQC